MTTINERIEALRAKMKANNIDAFIIPSSDPHQSEYVCDYWKVRVWFSGFTGSAGTLVVTQNEAAMWTDGRYFLQVEDQCADTCVELYKQQIPHAPEHIPWLAEVLNENAVIGIDYRQFSKSQYDYIQCLTSEKNIETKNYPHLLGEIWQDRPELPSDEVKIHPIEFSGESTASKLNKVKAEIKNQKANYYFLSSLDDIAWLFNIRSTDIDFTPLVTAYALVGEEKTYLFSDTSRYNSKTIEIFKQLNVEVLNYDLIAEKLPILSEGKIIVTDAASLNYASFDGIKGEIIFQQSLVQQLKAVKNEVEIENTKKCMLKDGVALTRFYMWLEETLENQELSEYEIGKKLTSYRAEQPLYKDDSFSSIVGYKGNGAIIHYSAPKEGSAMVKKENLLLIDSGGQYENGTTDITRTVWLGGEISDEIKTAYTSVLKGHIELDQMKFPKGTIGIQLDAFARMHLWKQGLNFPHGTGHGIGSYAMVHEPTQGFAGNLATSRGTEAHKPNQFTTIEPGCYKKDTYGIRIENVVVSKELETNSFGTFYGFEAITVFPIDTQLIDKKLLIPSEINWLNNYHKKVYEIISPKLKPSEKDWLKEKCKEI
ncbi:aminopeptidase P family protein [Lutibacter sp. TH_r2]|uniref:aminopeptidase P family protein n=1 Tax=Lutibacter sp. TH_r2 TaxID=3082083 RepID=UPI002952E8F0|nr:aminopeptidase P family protein [Lutibacter sp. TH_r2]MDV7187687.1 aminopeptidase P family protein [Lutibacter sp. TH_r2]